MFHLQLSILHSLLLLLKPESRTLEFMLLKTYFLFHIFIWVNLLILLKYGVKNNICARFLALYAIGVFSILILLICLDVMPWLKSKRLKFYDIVCDRVSQCVAHVMVERRQELLKRKRSLKDAGLSEDLASLTIKYLNVEFKLKQRYLKRFWIIFRIALFSTYTCINFTIMTVMIWIYGKRFDGTNLGYCNRFWYDFERNIEVEIVPCS